MRRLKHHDSWQGELGFTLQEVLIVLLLMGIVFAIASSSWFGVVESRRVDSATNQMVSDLRQAHTTATNRLVDWRVQWTSGRTNYQIGPDGGTLSARSLEEGTKLTGGVTAVVFRPNGGATIAGNIRVAADDGSPCHEIEVNTVTSRIKVLRNAC